MSGRLLMVVSVLGAWALFVALAIYLRLILRELRATGGTPTSFLAKIRVGLRAIEVETGHLVPEVTTLNERLTAIRDGLRAIDANLTGALDAVRRQRVR